MKTLTLSDHTADQVTSAAGSRHAQLDRDTHAYQSELDGRKNKISAKGTQVRQAWAQRQWFWVFAESIGYLKALFSPKSQAPVMQQATRSEVVWASGGDGERSVANYLAKLSDDWTLVCGYKNRKGEIDQVLVGPQGVFALEVKHINGTVHCDGDRWWSDKYDRYGNCVETGKVIADKRGRAPSKQINDSADALQLFLTQRVGVSRVHRAVVLSHENAKLGNLNNLTIDVISTLASLNLTRLFARSKATLTATEIARVIDGMRKDHAYHEKPRTAGQPANAAAQRR